MTFDKESNHKFGFKFYTESILCVIHVEDQAFSPLNDNVTFDNERTLKFGFKFYTESILCVIHVEDQAFLPWYDLDPCPSLPSNSPLSKQVITHNNISSRW